MGPRPQAMNIPALIGHHDIALIVLDSLRHDVARNALEQGRTPCLAGLLPGGAWEKRQTPGTFTYPAHQAFFMGYLPMPIPRPVPFQRLFACQFSGSESTGPGTWVTGEANIVQGLAQAGYHTLCIGGVGFFDKSSALRRVLPELFQESHWFPEMGVTGADSTRHQVALARARLLDLPRHQRVFLYLNISATHQPNCLFTPGATTDSPATQADALAYVDRHLPPLFEALRARGPGLCILCADHGTAYGEDGCHGHGLAHPVVWEVPYAEFLWEAAP